MLTAKFIVIHVSKQSMRKRLLVTAALIIGLLAYSWHPVEIAVTTDLPPAEHSWIRGTEILSQASTDVGEGSGVDVDSRGNVYFLHRAGLPFNNNGIIAKDVVFIYDRESGQQIGSWGSGLFMSPHGISIHQDTVWITDVMSNKVMQFDLQGQLLASYGRDYPFYLEACLRIRNVLTRLPCWAPGVWYARPTDVEVYDDGSFVVSDGYRNSRLIRQRADGSVIWTLGSIGREDGEFHLPHGLTKDRDGNLYVADRRNARIQSIDANGQWRFSWSIPELGRPYGLTWAEGHLWVVDAGDSHEIAGGIARSQLIQLDMQGNVVNRYSAFGNEPGQMDLPHDVAMGLNGELLVAEIRNLRLQVFHRRRATWIIETP